ncbi:pantoate--beta-alanine ligase [Flavobacterium sp. 3HN19-14]|uniref:pantoate--beta-alanine ligase n=1 Tax=Flavobacterium sp. 3HN19-14 TaxID=3448133 RepID=UPI003EE40D7E
MLIFTRQADLTAHLKSATTAKSTIGFVPTMGALHAGHLSLIAESLRENDFTVMSIFVNPTQFNNPEDLKKYPRTLEADVEKIRTLSEDVIIYAPTVEDIYEGNTVSQHFDYDGLENQMEGKHRPGHFDGVGTIVKRLFEIVMPTNAYFGEKDFQQLQIVKKLASKYNLPVNVIGRPIFREANGLAMSSRNERLSASEKEKSAFIYKTLNAAKALFENKSAEEVKQWVENEFLSQPDFKLEYFEIAEESTLLPVIQQEKDKKYRAFIAVFVNEIRLIDTISLN